MTPDIVKFLNQVGIVLNFLSFFLAAPEIIGAERLKVWVSHAAGGIAGYVIGIFCAGIVLLISTALMLTLYWYHSPITEIASPYLIIAALYVLPLVVFWLIFRKISDPITRVVINFFAADDSRRRWIFRTGVAMFVVGNVMQFAATL